MIWKPPSMKVRVSEDRMGNLLADPVSDRHRRRMVTALKRWFREFGGEPAGDWESDALVFAQEGFALQGELVYDFGFTQTDLNDINSGWDVVKIVPVETFENYVANTWSLPFEVFGG